MVCSRKRRCSSGSFPGGDVYVRSSNTRSALVGRVLRPAARPAVKVAASRIARTGARSIGYWLLGLVIGYWNWYLVIGRTLGAFCVDELPVHIHPLHPRLHAQRWTVEHDDVRILPDLQRADAVGDAQNLGRH